MSNEYIEKALQERLKEFGDSIKKIALEAIGEMECEILPHVMHDTEMNVHFKTEDAVRRIISGQFIFEDDYLVIESPHGSVRVRFQFTSSDYDNLRDAIIERMPKCPKDEKIKNLESQIKDMHERYYE